MSDLDPSIFDPAVPAPTFATPTPWDDHKVWLAWRHQGDKKPPIGRDGLLLKGWQHDLLTRAGAEERRVQAVAHGVGITMGAGRGGIDADDCRDPNTGALDARVVRLFTATGNAYAELSPSGEGLKIFGVGDGRWLELNFKTGKSQIKKGDYFTFTGRVCRQGTLAFDVPLDLERVADFVFGNGAARGERGSAALPPNGEEVPVGSRHDWLRNRAWMHAHRGLQFADVLAQLRVDVKHCSTEVDPQTETDLQGLAKSACEKVKARDQGPPPFPYPLTESGDAEHFAALYGGKLRFDYGQGRWFIFDGHHWRHDSDGEVDRLVLVAARLRQHEAVGNEHAMKHALRAEENNKRYHIELLARSCRPLAVSGETWDPDPWTLGVENGLLSLHDGVLRDGTPGDHVTRAFPLAYNPNALCPRWDEFLASTFQGRPEMVPYLRRVLGYALTAETSEHCFWFFYGEGANGKTTMIEVAKKVFGPYGWVMPFPGSGWTNSPTEYQRAALHGPRLVVSAEGGTVLDSAFLKDVTGGNSVNGRHPCGRPFTFLPTCKIFLCTNKLPGVRDQSHGLWRRVKLIEFKEKFAIDPQFSKRFDAELPGILAWMVRGCLEWQKQGLAHPAEVEAATEEYRVASDELSDFLADKTETAGDQVWTRALELFNAYRAWCDEQGVPLATRLGIKAFSKEMRNRFKWKDETRNRALGGRGVFFRGISIIQGGEEW